MKGRALRLLKSYLWKRLIEVVHNGKRSSLKEVFSGVTQGARWSPDLWNFNISEAPDVVSMWAMLITYADDFALWYEVTFLNRSRLTGIINADFEALAVWGDDNKALFENTKTYSMVVFRKMHPFDASEIVMRGH
jgi:hypothetical protein